MFICNHILSQPPAAHAVIWSLPALLFMWWGCTFNRGDQIFFQKSKGGTRKNWRPAITNRCPPLPLKKDSSLCHFFVTPLNESENMTDLFFFRPVGFHVATISYVYRLCFCAVWIEPMSHIVLEMQDFSTYCKFKCCCFHPYTCSPFECLQNVFTFFQLEALLREKLKNNFAEMRKRFKDNDPEGKGNVTK